MNDERWFDLIEQIKIKFEIISDETEDVKTYELDGSEMIVGTLQKIVFENDMGKMMVTRKTSPLVVGREEKYHKKPGVANTKLLYSDTEKVYHLAAYKWSNDMNDWEEISLKGTFTF